ncbi:hypothetical protein AB0L82_15790 [Nocardia sp. NPDC052001]|uniref:hypothetical protein n=1 Tax=Nocardia sp. NPDC052001 TaxID=3154853 RepID=UPI003444A433
MRKSVIAAALLALPLLAACSTNDSTPANLVTASSAPAAAVTTTASPGGTTATTSPAKSGAPTTSGTATPGGSTLTAPQISKSLQDKGGLDAKTADCVAGIYIDTGLSDSGIQKLIDHGYNNPATLNLTSEDFRKAGAAVKRITTECVK